MGHRKLIIGKEASSNLYYIATSNLSNTEVKDFDFSPYAPISQRNFFKYAPMSQRHIFKYAPISQRQ